MRYEQSHYAYDLVSQCRFLSRLQKIDRHNPGAWKLLKMEVIYIYDSILPAFPQSEHSPIIMEIMPAFTRSSYKYLSWLLMEQGRKVNSRMPGIDDDKLFMEVMDRNYNWLNSVDR